MKSIIVIFCIMWSLIGFSYQPSQLTDTSTDQFISENIDASWMECPS